MAKRRLAARTALIALAASTGAVSLGALSRQEPRAPAPIASPAAGERVLLSKDELLPLAGNEEHRVRSILNIDRRMQFGEFVWNDRNVPQGELLVRVDLRTQTLSVFRAGHEIGAAVILYGADDKPTPRGTFPIIEKRAEHRSNLYDADMPYMLRLTNDGIAIHGSDVQLGAATHGCIGVPTAFARSLFSAVKRGDKVSILS